MHVIRVEDLEAIEEAYVSQAIAEFGIDPTALVFDVTNLHTVTASYTYDQANRLTSYTGPVVGAAAQGTTTQASYVYQAGGLRADMAWDRAEGMPLILSSPTQVPGGIQEYVTGPGGRVVEIDLLPIASASGTLGVSGFTTTQTVYVHADAMGSTRVISDAGGRPLLSYTYDPFGQAALTTLSSSTISIVNPFLFQGQYVDPLSGFMYMRNRWYDPTTAQFLTRDPLVSLTRSAYEYAGEDPVNGSDPSGLCICPSVCPLWLITAARWVGPGDAVRLVWHLSVDHYNSDQLQHGALSFLTSVGTFVIPGIIGFTLTGLSIVAGAVDLVCAVDRQVP